MNIEKREGMMMGAVVMQKNFKVNKSDAIVTSCEFLARADRHSSKFSEDKTYSK